MNKGRDNNYIVSKYTDSELYDILDLVTPSDRVLEAKIIQMINRYSAIPGESGEKLTQFFKDIYNRFFYDNEEEEEGFQEEEEEGENEKIVEGLENSAISVSDVITASNTSTLIGNITASSGRPINPYDKTKQNIVSNDADKTKIVSVNPTVYVQSQLNPLLKQTVKRVISIDSQYRDNKETLSTNFTFNLSESLKNVLALRLYSIQIPYTWYTISNNYGGNFFYLKGNSPGIDDGTYDYKIEIPSGNYNPTELSIAVNTGLTSMKTNNLDVSFCDTNIAYDIGTCKVTFSLQIKNNYDETNYNLIFDNNPALSKYPTETDACGNELRYSTNALSTISSYLGFNNNNYCPNAIISGKLPSIRSSSSFDTANSIFVIDSSNSSFTIYQYIVPSAYVTTSTIITTAIITLQQNRYTRNGLVTEVNKQLSSHPSLTNSSISRVDILDPSGQDYGSSYFKMVINWKKTIPNQNINSLKTVVVFPDETNTTNRIWTYVIGTTNCFHFLNMTSELNNIISETSVNQTNYIINSKPYILLKCIAPGYTVDYTGLVDSSGALTTAGLNTFSSITSNDISYRIKNKNDYLITVPNSSGTGYSLDQYLAAINAGIDITNTGSKEEPSNTNGIINTQNTQIYNNPATSKISLKVDLVKSFTTNSYFIDLSGSYLYDTLGVGKGIIGTTGVADGMRIDLSNNSVFTGTIPGNFSTYGSSNIYIAKVYPNGRLVDNSNAAPFEIFPTSTENIDITRFSGMITNSLKGFLDPDGSTPFSESSFTMSIDQNSGVVTSTLTIKVNKYLTEKNYTLSLYDPSSNGVLAQNSWSNNLKLTDLSYSLIQYNIENTSYSEISGTATLSGYTYTIREPTKIILRGVNPGVKGTNDFTINIPAAPSPNYTYTLQQIYELINTAFSENSITNGSSISTTIIGGKNYVNIRLNINKTYTEKDYRLVFYDPFSFATCTSGVSVTRNATWDSTLGWILGFRAQTEYDFSSLSSTTYTIKPTGGITLIGDTTVSTNLYNYFLIILNDYTQSHLNDGLVTLTPQQTSIELPSYANRATFQCDTNGKKTFAGTLSNTQNQIYSVNQIESGNANKLKTYSKGPFVQDIFGLIPIKAGTNSSTYVEFGGTLQNQERTYFGPVNLKRMNIQLITDRGDPVDLNGQNWSFSFICEQLYEQTSIAQQSSK